MKSGPIRFDRSHAAALIDQEAARVEQGLAVMASAGSASPYIGLFGTVWGIYHALANIGISGQGTLDKVSGPVGEALIIMTALGLAVATPAVLAYNGFTRRNRVWLARLDAFAYDLYALLTVGEKANSPAAAYSTLKQPPIPIQKRPPFQSKPVTDRHIFIVKTTVRGEARPGGARMMKAACK